MGKTVFHWNLKFYPLIGWDEILCFNWSSAAPDLTLCGSLARWVPWQITLKNTAAKTDMQASSWGRRKLKSSFYGYSLHRESQKVEWFFPNQCMVKPLLWLFPNYYSRSWMRTVAGANVHDSVSLWICDTSNNYSDRCFSSPIWALF